MRESGWAFPERAPHRRLIVAAPALEDTAPIAKIAARKVCRRTPLPGCEEPGGLALTSSGVLIAACANGVAKTVDAASGKPGVDLVIGRNPDAVLFDAARARACIPSGGDGTLSIIDTARTPRIIGKVATQRGARTGAVDPVTGAIYLPIARYADAGAGRPKAVPGSFEVLVVSR